MIQTADAPKSMLEIIKKEVEYEKERKKQLETRAGTLLGFMLTVITLQASTSRNIAHNIIHNIFFYLYSYAGFWSVIIMINIIASIYYLYLSIRDYSKVLFELQRYACIPSDGIIRLAYDDKNENIFSLHAAKLIRKVLLKNRELNDLKASLFISASRNLKYSIIFDLVWSFICVIVGI